ncbi:tRNA (uracil-5-)-methyltransferase A [Blattella germanica]|nr:tRNA (uracil-5-)-methyltransferase A [Blattella germanica]
MESAAEAEIKDVKPLNDDKKLEESVVEPGNINVEKVVENINEGDKKDDPFAYLHRDFTSEKYKIVIRGLPKHFGIGIATPAPDPLVKKRREQTMHNESNEGTSEAKKQKLDDRTQEERLHESVTPLWNVPYEKQLEQKQRKVREILLKLGSGIERSNPDLKPWLNQQREKYNGLPCELWKVRPSPVVDGYRNKCEFTVGMNVETGQRTVGFRLGSYVKGFIGVGPIDSLKHIPERMKEAAKMFEKFVQNSELDVFNPETHEGYWRQLMVRLSQNTNQLMLVVGIHPQSLSKEELEETLLGLKFRVSPEAFFQVNTAATEILYNSVAELSRPTQDTAMIDICCGTGSIGLCLAKQCGQVLGLELLSQAVDDAKSNAANNNVTNCDFFVGKAEDILGSVKNRATKEDLLAVVDPPRAGLHQKAIVQLRRAGNLKKLVFLSCDPNAALKNFVDLARPTSKNYRGDPLVPVRAVPVDMFPYTAHCELVLYFERLDVSQMIEVDNGDDSAGNASVKDEGITIEERC